ncbi:MAG: hypothetical protein K2N54_03310 [Helicobacter sp.]|nr:hypothetical protein [Helicobacter sp.]
MITNIDSKNMPYAQQPTFKPQAQNDTFANLLDSFINNALQEAWSKEFPNSSFQVLETSQIAQNLWDRNDYPFEHFFENMGEAALQWQPNGADLGVFDESVQAKLAETLGKMALVIPQELNEKLQQNPSDLQKILDKIDSFLYQNGFVASDNTSALLALDNNGDIAFWRLNKTGKLTVSAQSSESAPMADLLPKTKDVILSRTQSPFL